ncbi:MAG TPA: hypothetical protein VLC79_17160 [Cellvibrio sp.]|nr:hypothetical protein [Cellvibrio sp.]
MSISSADQGTIQVLLTRLNNLRIPRALDLKAKVDRGDLLTEHDLESLQSVFEDANNAQALVARNPELHEVAARLVSLYSEITRKALENEQTKGR